MSKGQIAYTLEMPLSSENDKDRGVHQFPESDYIHDLALRPFSSAYWLLASFSQCSPLASRCNILLLLQDRCCVQRRSGRRNTHRHTSTVYARAVVTVVGC